MPAGPAAGPAVVHFDTHELLLKAHVGIVLCCVRALCVVCVVCVVCVQRLYLASALALVSAFVAFCFHCSFLCYSCQSLLQFSISKTTASELKAGRWGEGGQE